MKKWLKRHGKSIGIAVGLLFIINSMWGIIKAAADWHIVFHGIVVAIWLVIMITLSGVADRLFEWWEKE